jgi:predicted HicB family RNase H-like nuclease
MTNREKLSAYKLEITPLAEEDGGGFQALYPQLARSVVGYGQTAGEAVADLQTAADLFLQSMDEAGEPLPEPVTRPPWEEFSGRVTLRIAKSLHYRLANLADAEGVSLNSMLSDILQSGATALESGHRFGAVNAWNPSLLQWKGANADETCAALLNALTHRKWGAATPDEDAQTFRLVSKRDPKK